MASRISKEGKALRAWRESQEPRVTQDELGRAVGVSGSAIRHFERAGAKFPMALGVKVKLCNRTGLPLETIVNADELTLARELVAVMARDAAA